MSEAESTQTTTPVELRRSEAAMPATVARNERITVFAWRGLIVVALLAAWEFSSGRLIKPFWISSPSEIWARLAEWIATGQLWLHVEVTLTETLLGFGFG